MTQVVGVAQRDFEFSVIYEQRKTNQILVAGFKSLAQALDQMTWRITSSIDELSATVERVGSKLNDSLQQIRAETRNVAAQMAGHREDIKREAVRRVEREEKALEMLDNIQRKRYPSFLHGGLRPQ
jgi:molecular chaperone GrpE (heat shock protein)